MKAPRRGRVLVADDHRLVAEGMSLALGPYHEVVGIVGQLSALRPNMVDTRPDVVVLDLSFDGVSSLPTMQALIPSFGHRCRFLIVTAHQSRSLCRAAMESGASGFVLKGCSTQALRVAIDTVLSGGSYVAPELRSGLSTVPVAIGPRYMISVGGVSMPKCRLHVLALVADGFPRPELASSLGISLKGVEYHVAAAKRQTGLRRTLDLLRWVEEHRSEIDVQLLGNRERD